MTRFATLVAAVCVFAIGLSTVNAAPLYVDKFDQYADQAAFNAPGAWPALSPQPTGTLSTEQSSSFPKSVKIEAPLAGGTPTAQRNQHIGPEWGSVLTSPSGEIHFSFDFYDVAPAAAPYRQHANLQDSTAASATNQLISMGLQNTITATGSGGQYYMARILGYSPTTVDPDGGPNNSLTGSGAYFKLNDFDPTPLNTIADGPGARSLGWHNLKVVLSSDDGIATDYKFYVDDILTEIVNNVGGAGTIRSYDVIRIGSGTSSAEIAYYDNVVVTIPEPASLALAGLALFGLSLASRRRTA